MPGDDADLFAALDFGDELGNNGCAATDFVEDTGAELAALDALNQDTSADDEDLSDADGSGGWQLTTLTNPAETVSVTASMDGQIRGVELSANVATMTESELAEEVLVVADLTRQRALSAQHALLARSLRAIGADDEAIRDLLDNGMGLPSPEQAAEAQAHVFVTRYISHTD
ncbi:hypothetical protein [Mycobacterium decipiens]|uniref:ESX-1 secretion-associated protein EspH n=1 Tax=Mycobacterium decipiens TaxID=1430326 RepID=A0A1X2LTY9_9MYCO|nr:hypothetical protein [Mycobacterium decipiens]OSC40342.1 hypothetical protein B8W66_13650 [Mycobacterium decipiens]